MNEWTKQQGLTHMRNQYTVREREKTTKQREKLCTDTHTHIHTYTHTHIHIHTQNIATGTQTQRDTTIRRLTHIHTHTHTHTHTQNKQENKHTNTHTHTRTYTLQLHTGGWGVTLLAAAEAETEAAITANVAGRAQFTEDGVGAARLRTPPNVGMLLNQRLCHETNILGEGGHVYNCVHQVARHHTFAARSHARNQQRLSFSNGQTRRTGSHMCKGLR
jgi:hypothetical protein